jgi:predicted dehydrogenase
MTAAVKADSTMLRVLQLGYGAFGPVHAEAWVRHGFGDRLVIADPLPEARARAALHVPQARIVSGPIDVADGVDIVDIVSPADQHALQVMAALEGGCDVFVEKPFVVDLEETRQIVARLATSDRILQVGYFFRFHPLALALRTRLAEGAVGDAFWIEADFTSLKRPRRDSGALLNDAVHFIDLVCWLVGIPPVEVTAHLRHPLGRAHEDVVVLLLGWRDGLVARVQASCVLAGPHPDPVVPGGFSRKTVMISGTHGQLVADFMTGTLNERDARLNRRGQDAWETEVAPVRQRSFAAVATADVVSAEVAGFLEAVATRRQPGADLASGVLTTAICDAVRRSARERRTVEITT